MTSQQIETLQVGQTGLYSWNKTLPICRLHPVRKDRDGKTFRYIEVTSATGNASIGFTVREG